MKSRDDIFIKMKEEYDLLFEEKVKMMNLYFNNFLSKEDKKQLKYIKISETSKYFNVCYIIIKDFWKELYFKKELVLKILKYAKKEDLKKLHLNIFFMHNFYVDLFSNSFHFPNELYYIIQNLLNDIIIKVNKISDFSIIFQESNLYYLLEGLILNDKIRSFFYLILSDIIEQYENSEESFQILLFKVNQIDEYFKIKKAALNENNFKKSEIEKIQKRENKILNKIYRMKLPNILNEISLNETFLELGFDELIDKDYKNNEVFTYKYLPELNKNDMLELLRKENNEKVKYYITNQLSLIEEDNHLYSNKKFLENIQKCSESEKYLYFYQKNFMITINIIKQIFKKLNEYEEIIPEEIKNISIMIMESLKNKFNSINTFEIYKYVSEFFMILFKAYFLSPDYNSLINSVILSKNTKNNLKIMYDIILKLISGKFYTNSKEECDYTPFNLFFLEIIPEYFNFCEKLLDNSNYKLEQKNENIITNSIIYNVHDLATILNIINHNYNKFFLNDNDENSDDEFLKIFQKLKSNKEIFTNLKKKEKEEKEIFFFAYNEIIYSQKLLNIINRNQNKYFKIEELKDDKTIEEVNSNKIIRAKNLIFDLLYISPKLNRLTNLSINSDKKNTKEILIELNKYFKGIYEYNENDNKNILNKEKISNNNNEISKIPKDWYINSLLVCLENLDNEYAKNDYRKLYNSIKEDLNKSIKNYDFGDLTKILRDLKSITLFKNKFKTLQEKYKDIEINLKIRDIIENESLPVVIHFIYNSTQKIFNIKKIEKNIQSKIINDKLLIKCLTINDFIRQFPNLSLIQQRKDIDLYLIEKEINLSKGLNQYFNIIKDLINIKFDKEEKNIVFNKIQKYILTKIYDKIYPRESDKDDMLIFQKTVLLSWVNPYHLKLDKTYLENFIPITTKYIKQLDNEKSPNGKFNIINKIFNTINNVLIFIKGNSFSIDDIAPICEYCLIKAQPERLSSNLKYLQNFISNDGSDLRKMRFDILKNCMINIKEINYKKFEGVTKEEYEKLCIMARTE